MLIDLENSPQFVALRELCEANARELLALKALLPAWVREEEAQRLAGLSRSQLYRERHRPGSLIRWKQDR